MPAIPELIGVDLDEAQTRAHSAGLLITTVAETLPPRPIEFAGPLRVVRVREGAGGTLDLVVCHERYVPPLTPR